MQKYSTLDINDDNEIYKSEKTLDINDGEIYHNSEIADNESLDNDILHKFSQTQEPMI